MLTIGLTGGIASGKSAVSAMLRELGAPVFDADEEARRLAAKDGGAYMDIKDYFCGRLGLDILTCGGEIDRKKLGALVFSDRALLSSLEDVLHNRVKDAMERFIAKRLEPVVVLDIPLLIEKAWQDKVDKVWLIYLPEDLQIRRLRARDGLDEAAARARLAAQLKLHDKLKYADLVIDNSGDLLNTKAQVTAAWRALTAAA